MLHFPLALLLLAAAPAPPGPPPFISPMGEPFRAGGPEAGFEAWFAGADSNGDGALGADEVRKDAARFFATLETDGDGEIEPSEMARYESEIAPEIQLGRGPMSHQEIVRMRRLERREEPSEGSVLMGSPRIRGGARYGGPSGLQGAGRFGLINIPQPVMAADSDLNRGVSAAEFSAAAGARFLLLDSDKDGKLARPELLAQLPRMDARRERLRR